MSRADADRLVNSLIAAENAPMALRDVSLSDEPTTSDQHAETRRQLINAYERIEDLEGAVRGLLGLVQLLSNNRDLPASLREVLATNHRVIDAQELLR